MANTNAPTGFRPVRYKSGAPYNGAANMYFVPSSDSTALFIGDPVIIAGGADADGIATVTRATAASAGRISGVVVGIVPTNATTAAYKYRPASVDTYILVADDPDLVFEAQEDAVGGALAAADVGLNADMVAGSGSTVTGLSGFQIDTSTKATTATLQWRIIGFVPRQDNEIGANAKIFVRINLPTETGAAGSTGV